MKNSNTRPMVAFVEEKDFGALTGEDEEKDGQFLQIVQQSAPDSSSSVFLLGEGFNGEWCQDSLRLLCHNRFERIFRCTVRWPVRFQGAWKASYPNARRCCFCPQARALG